MTRARTDSNEDSAQSSERSPKRLRLETPTLAIQSTLTSVATRSSTVVLANAKIELQQLLRDLQPRTADKWRVVLRIAQNVNSTLVNLGTPVPIVGQALLVFGSFINVCIGAINNCADIRSLVDNVGFAAEWFSQVLSCKVDFSIRDINNATNEIVEAIQAAVNFTSTYFASGSARRFLLVGHHRDELNIREGAIAAAVHKASLALILYLLPKHDVPSAEDILGLDPYPPHGFTILEPSEGVRVVSLQYSRTSECLLIFTFCMYILSIYCLTVVSSGLVP